MSPLKCSNTPTPQLKNEPIHFQKLVRLHTKANHSLNPPTRTPCVATSSHAGRAAMKASQRRASVANFFQIAIATGAKLFDLGGLALSAAS